MRISWFRSYLFVIVLWILGSITIEVKEENENMFTWSKGLLKKYTQGVDEKSMDICVNEYTLPILSTAFFHLLHLFVYSCSFCSFLSPSSFQTLVIYFTSQYHIWAIISLIISWTCLLWVIKLGSFNSYLHTASWHTQNYTRNCISTAICSLYSIYNAWLNLPRFYCSRETGRYQYRHD